MNTPQLLAVVEVDPSERVLCQAESCGHSIYKRIHIIDLGDRITIVGSDCFARLYGEGPLRNASPRFGAREGNPLSAQEREQLVERTQDFVAALEMAHLQRLAEEERQAREAAEGTQVIAPQLLQPLRIAIHLRFDAWFKSLTDDERHAYARIRMKTEADMRRDMGIDPTLPGFVGMLSVRTREAFDNRMSPPAPAAIPADVTRTTRSQASTSQGRQPSAEQDSLFD